MKQLYFSKVFMFDETEITQDGGYCGSISQLCEKIKQSIDISAEKVECRVLIIWEMVFSVSYIC